MKSEEKYDYLIVGSGLMGATFAHLATRSGKRCLVIDKRPNLGGNLYCEQVEGINVHKYGAHIFHTSNKEVWDFVNSIVEFNRYTNSPVANYKGKLYNLPFNMNTFNRLWGVTTPAEAEAKIAEQREEAIEALGGCEPQNLEEQALTLVGKDIFNILIKEYTEKLFEHGLAEDDVRNLIFLGTGRLYSKGSFAKYGLQKLTDFNRRVVFVLFMNILASSGIYLLFAIDELEKINDKSNKRMAHFFTSYRELLDLFNKINGHYMISAITNGVDVQALCQPLYERLNTDIVFIEKIKTDTERAELVKLMSDLLDVNIHADEIQNIVSKLGRNSKLINNRRIIQETAELLKNIEFTIENKCVFINENNSSIIFLLIILLVIFNVLTSYIATNLSQMFNSSYLLYN